MIAVNGSGVALILAEPDPVVIGVSCFIVGALTPGILPVATGRIAELVGTARHREVWGL